MAMQLLPYFSDSQGVTLAWCHSVPPSPPSLGPGRRAGFADVVLDVIGVVLLTAGLAHLHSPSSHKLDHTSCLSLYEHKSTCPPRPAATARPPTTSPRPTPPAASGVRPLSCSCARAMLSIAHRSERRRDGRDGPVPWRRRAASVCSRRDRRRRGRAVCAHPHRGRNGGDGVVRAFLLVPFMSVEERTA
jgi:hypothetical protein